IGWTESLSGILVSLLNQQSPLTTPICIATRRMVLPWEFGTENILAEALVSQICSNQDADLLTLLKSMVQTLSTKAFPNVRNVWFEVVRRNAATVDDFTPPTIQTDDESPTESPQEVNQPQIRLPDGSKSAVNTAIATVTSVSSASALLKVNPSAYEI